MSEQSGQDNYIKCKGCKCKYINDDEHIKEDFGYNRLGERLKTCVKCRNKNKRDNEQKKQQIVDTNINCLCTRCYQIKPKSDFGEYKTCERCREQCKQYQVNHVKKPNPSCKLKRKQWIERLKKEADESNGVLRHCNRCYKNKSPDAFVCPNGKSYNACYACLKKKYKQEDDNTSKSSPSSKRVVKVDGEIVDYVLNLLARYSTNQLDSLMMANNSEHIMAYAEAKLNKKDTTFRDMSWVDVFPLIVKLNNMADHASSSSDEEF